MKGIKYILNDEVKVYYPDFYLPKYNLIVENHKIVIIYGIGSQI